MQANLKMTVYHTKSHVGITRNDEVDKLCNIKTQKTDRISLISTRSGSKTSQRVKNWVKNWTKENRRKKILGLSTKDSKTLDLHKKIYKDNTRVPSIHKNLPREGGVLLSKARANRWTLCNQYKNMMKLNIPPLCKKCNVLDDTEHVINNCSRHENERGLLLHKCKYKYKNVTELLTTENETEISHLVHFLLNIQERRKQEYEKENL